MTYRIVATAWLTLGVGLAGCNYYEEKDTDDDDGGGDVADPGTTPDLTNLSYESIVADVLKPKCFQCHSNSGGSSGGLNTESYEAVKAKATVIKSRAIDAKNMPLGGSLSSDQLAKLQAWLEKGAPEKASTLTD